MTQVHNEQLDDTGKQVFDDAYNQPDPRMYYEDLGQHGYRIAGEAQPIIAKVVAELSRVRSLEQPKIIDVGCSYGINSALMSSDLKLRDLDKHYRTDDITDWSRAQVLERDIKYFDAHSTGDSPEVVGIDVSAKALKYAVDAGLLEDAIAKNLEEEPLSPEEASILKGSDLIMSTGAVGYVSEKTFTKVLDASDGSKPWVANTVLRMFPYDGYLKLLADRGYVTEKYDSTLIQRAFASEEERANVFNNLEALGIDPTGLESDGHYHAEFFLSRPEEDAKTPIFDRIHPAR